MAAATFDVAIAGAGPAGCASAMAFLQAGKRVCLIDDVPAGGLCVGEALPGAAARLLKRLGFSGPEALLAAEHFHPCLANASKWYTADWVYQDAIRNPEGGGWHIDRAQFNQALRQATQRHGATHFLGKTATVSHTNHQGFELTFKKQQPHLPRQLFAHLLVDATGRASYVARQLGATRTRIHEQLAAVGWFKAPPTDKDQTTRVLKTANGWWYTARLPKQRRVVAYHGTAEAVADLVRAQHQFFEQLQPTDLLPYPLTAHELLQPLVARDAGVSRLQTPCGPGWAAVGDAALGFDPISSQGMFFGMYSGIRAAEMLLQNAETFMPQYSQLVQRVFEANERARAEFYPQAISTAK